jgi:hypothetical protein
VSLYGGTPSVATAGTVATAGGAGDLAFTGAHIASEAILAVGLLFLGAGLVKLARRRTHSL